MESESKGHNGHLTLDMSEAQGIATQASRGSTWMTRVVGMANQRGSISSPPLWLFLC